MVARFGGGKVVNLVLLFMARKIWQINRCMYVCICVYLSNNLDGLADIVCQKFGKLSLPNSIEMNIQIFN